MLVKRLRNIITAPKTNYSKKQIFFWFTLSLAFAALYGFLALQQAFSSDYVVQDDARQHVFWMQRFMDSELLPKDLIADYFQSVAPSGYTVLYQLGAALGIHPLLFNKLLPIFLGLITTSYCFAVCLQMLPVPAAGFIASLLLNQGLWMKDDLVSATPRAFIYPLLLAFLYYLLRRSLLLCLVAILLLGLFYPQSVLIAAGVMILQLLSFEGGRIRFSRNKNDYFFLAAGLGLAILVLLPYAIKTSQFGPVISVAQAKTLPALLPGGRTQFFDHNPWLFWLTGDLSGMFASLGLMPITNYTALLLPFLLKYPSLLPRKKKVKREIALLGQLIWVSLGLFIATHVFLFKLHVPSRYTQHSLRIVIALAAAITLIICLDAVFAACQKFPLGQVWAMGTAALLTIALIFYPSFLNSFPKTLYVVGGAPELYEFFAQQPKDSLIASLSREADNLPTFSGRSVLLSREYGIPFHTGYYDQFRQRARDLIEAQYSPNLGRIQQFIQQYGIDFWLLEDNAFTPEYIANYNWLQQYQPEADIAKTRLEQATVPALLGLIESCSIFHTKEFVVLGAECIEKAG